MSHYIPLCYMDVITYPYLNTGLANLLKEDPGVGKYWLKSLFISKV